MSVTALNYFTEGQVVIMIYTLCIRSIFMYFTLFQSVCTSLFLVLNWVTKIETSCIGITLVPLRLVSL